MLGKIEKWEYFPTAPALDHEKTGYQRFDEVVNRYAARCVDIILAGAPWFWVALFLAYLAVSFGIISWRNRFGSEPNLKCTDNSVFPGQPEVPGRYL
jgi:hypothetical protein